MLRKVAAVAVVLGLGMGLVLADEFTISIRKIEGDKITAMKGGKFNKETKKLEGAEEVTLTVAANVKVVKGAFNKDTKKIEAGEAIEGGLKNEMFTKIGEKGIAARVVTGDDGKVTEIRVLGAKKVKKTN
ncbi:MAG: hypothetical protein NZO58_03985 [Gemmataceae bacterium]|nr:hypothetical protein [Gemmataceae bacterium]